MRVKYVINVKDTILMKYVTWMNYITALKYASSVKYSSRTHRKYVTTDKFNEKQSSHSLDKEAKVHGMAIVFTMQEMGVITAGYFEIRHNIAIIRFK